MSDITCRDCGATMDQSDGCTHVCPPNPLLDRIVALENEVRALHRQIDCYRRSNPLAEYDRRRVSPSGSDSR